MTIVDTKPRRGRASSGSSPTAIERETFRDFKNSNQVKFVITDPADLNDICESCIDECAGEMARNCVR
jgi:hypothetical protein